MTLHPFHLNHSLARYTFNVEKHCQVPGILYPLHLDHPSHITFTANPVTPQGPSSLATHYASNELRGYLTNITLQAVIVRPLHVTFRPPVTCTIHALHVSTRYKPHRPLRLMF